MRARSSLSHGADRLVIPDAAPLLNEDKDDMNEGKGEDDRAADGVEPGVHWVQHVVEGRAETGQGALSRTVVVGVIGEERQVVAVEGEEAGVVEQAVGCNQTTRGQSEEHQRVHLVEPVEKSSAIASIFNVLP